MKTWTFPRAVFLQSKTSRVIVKIVHLDRWVVFFSRRVSHLYNDDTDVIYIKAFQLNKKYFACYIRHFSDSILCFNFFPTMFLFRASKAETT